MSLFRKRPKTAQQKAQMAKSRIMIRALAIAFLVWYVIIPFINMGPEDIEEVGAVLRYVVIVFFILACVAVAALTIHDYIKDKKAGKFDPASYTDDVIEGAEETVDDNDGDEDDDDDDEDEDEEE